LTWAPLLAGVIVPSFGPHQVAGFPGLKLDRGAGDDTGMRGTRATSPTVPGEWIRRTPVLERPWRSAG
jgi:hypothetical protein